MNYRSEELGILFGALGKAQGAYKPLVCSQEGPGGKYANLNDVLNAVREALAANGLSLYQYIELKDQGDGSSLLWTSLGHESGQYISSCSRVIQYVTYRETMNANEGYKRMHATMLLGISPSQNDPLLFDDNGAEQLDKQILEDIRHPERKDSSEFRDTITKDQYDDLMHELEGQPQIAKGILKFYNINALSDIPKTEFYNAQHRIRNIKKTHEEYVRDKK